MGDGTVVNVTSPARVFLSADDKVHLDKEQLLQKWSTQEIYLNWIESQVSTLQASIVTTQENDDKARQSISSDASRRENIFLMRLASKEQEIQDLMVQYQELKASQASSAVSLRSSLLDPAINLLVHHLRQELEKAKSSLEETQNELSAWKFTPDSNTGKRLMAKCRLLYQENEELGRVISSGRLAKLEGDLALQRNFCEEMKKSQSELDEFLLELDEDVEGMQSTIYFLQQQLRQTREQVAALEKENKILRNSIPGTTELEPIINDMRPSQLGGKSKRGVDVGFMQFHGTVDRTSTGDFGYISPFEETPSEPSTELNSTGMTLRRPVSRNEVMLHSRDSDLYLLDSDWQQRRGTNVDSSGSIIERTGGGQSGCTLTTETKPDGEPQRVCLATTDGRPQSTESSGESRIYTLADGRSGGSFGDGFCPSSPLSTPAPGVEMSTLQAHSEVSADPDDKDSKEAAGLSSGSRMEKKSEHLVDLAYRLNVSQETSNLDDHGSLREIPVSNETLLQAGRRTLIFSEERRNEEQPSAAIPSSFEGEGLTSVLLVDHAARVKCRKRSASEADVALVTHGSPTSCTSDIPVSKFEDDALDVRPSSDQVERSNNESYARCIKDGEEDEQPA